MIRRIRQIFHNWRDRLAFRYMPRVAESLVWAASAKALPSLRAKAPIKLLLDSNIHAHAITHEEAWIDTGTVLWGGVHPISTGYVARVPVHSLDNRTREYRDLCRLTVIASLTRKGIFSLYTSAELMAERESQPARRFQTGMSEYSLLDGAKVESLDGWNFDALTMKRPTSLALKEAQRNRLGMSGDELFESILTVLGDQKHSQDAWHMRTAQAHGMYAFLTMDYSLVRHTEAQRKRLERNGIYIRVLTPTELADELDLGGVPPSMFSYTDASFPVRSDLHMPGERRRVTAKSKMEASSHRTRID